MIETQPSIICLRLMIDYNCKEVPLPLIGSPHEKAFWWITNRILFQSQWNEFEPWIYRVNWKRNQKKIARTHYFRFLLNRKKFPGEFPFFTQMTDIISLRLCALLPLSTKNTPKIEVFKRMAAIYWTNTDRPGREWRRAAQQKMRTSTPHSPEEAGIQDIAEGNRGS